MRFIKMLPTQMTPMSNAMMRSASIAQEVYPAGMPRVFAFVR
jgi:hypothetical protein